MKILHLITTIDRGGAENHLSCLARGQKLKNNDVTVIYLKGNNYWKKFLNSKGIKCINLSQISPNKLNLIKKIFFIRSFIIKNKIDILHSHLPHMELISWFVLIFSNFKLKYFITKHLDNNMFGGSNYKSNSLIADIIYFIITKKTKKIICISKAVKNYYLNNFFSVKDKLKIIYYGIDKNYSKNLKSKIKIKNIPSKQIVFGSVGRLAKQKNVNLIIQSYKNFCDKTKISSCLVIAGDGPEKIKLKKFARSINIHKKITWLGHVNNVGDVFNKIDVFCMNSKFEGLGLVLLEAMAYSKPIIAPKVSAIPEVVVNMKNGILVEEDNSNEYTKAMIKLTNKKLRNKLSIKSEKILKKKFSFDKMVNKTLELYSS